MVPQRTRHYCEIDPGVVDAYGIPVLRFHAGFREHEVMQAKHMQDTFREIIHEMGGTPMSAMPTTEALSMGWCRSDGSFTKSARRGWAATPHVGPERELPGARCEEPFVADGGPFVSNAHKNCTWTILALAMRTSEDIARQRNQGTLLMKNITRRAALHSSPGPRLPPALVWTPAEARTGARPRRQPRSHAAKTGDCIQAEVFHRARIRHGGLLVNLIIPRDERSGSATDAGVPAFMVSMMTDQPQRQSRCAAASR